MSSAVLTLGLSCQLQASFIPLRSAIQQLGVDPSSSLLGTLRSLPFLAQTVGITQADERSVFGGGMKAFGSLLLVLSIIFTIAFLLRRYLPCYFGMSGNKRLIQIVENVSLGDKRNLTLVRVGSDRLLLGCTANSISVLEKIQFPIEDAVEAPNPTDGELRFESRGQASHFPAIKWVLRSLSGRRTDLNGNPRRLSNQEASTSSLSFGEILEQNAEGSNPQSNDNPTRAISRLAEIRRNLQAR